MFIKLRKESPMSQALLSVFSLTFAISLLLAAIFSGNIEYTTTSYFPIKTENVDLCETYYFANNFTRSEITTNSSLRNSIIECGYYDSFKFIFNDSIQMVVDFQNLNLTIRIHDKRRIDFYYDQTKFEITLLHQLIYLEKYQQGMRKRTYSFIDYSQIELYFDLLNNIEQNYQKFFSPIFDWRNQGDFDEYS